MNTLSSANHSIGDILVNTGRLSTQDASRIVELQQSKNLQFGDAALALNILKKEDIDFALSQQFDYSYLGAQDTSLSPTLVAAYKPFSTVGENLRAVRSQLMLRWFNNASARKALTVVSAGAGEGRSFIAANLAIVFAQQGQRTVLVDGNLRAQAGHGQQALFKLGKSAGLSEILADRAGLEAIQTVTGLPNLSVLTAGATPPNPQELLGRSNFGELLRALSEKFDVILFDSPSGNDFADAEILASRTGAALMVARMNKSLLSQTSQLAQRLQASGVALVGSVLNDA